LAQTPIADGFFADGVVLVEGEEDVAFVRAAAAFEETLQHTVREEVGVERWNQALRDMAYEAGYVKVRDASKNPLVLLDAYERARTAGGDSPTLVAIAEALRVRFVP
jgi:hypothetical protein